jgi:hypothetical protein
VPWAWKKLSQVIDRTTHRSSAQRDTLGNSSLTSIPARPYFANFHGEGKALPSGRALPSSLLVFSGRTGSRLPSHLASSGLGSKVSIWEGPPDMNRKMIRFARGVKWGIFVAPTAFARAESASTPARATEPNPPASWPSICRRVSGSVMSNSGGSQ